MKPIVDPHLLLLAGVFVVCTIAILTVLKNLAIKKAAVQEEPKVWFSPDPNGGEMEYESKEGNFKMEYEFGSGDVLAIVHLPELENWQAQTGVPVECRVAVLNFIGQKTLEKQTNGKGSFTLEGNSMIIWKETIPTATHSSKYQFHLQNN